MTLTCLQDDLYDNFLQTGSFPGDVVETTQRPHDLLMWLFWAVLLGVPLIKFLAQVFLAGSLASQAAVVIVVVSGEI